MEIDLNADLGEGAGFDAELMPLITSANVCCGLHAGGPTEIAATLDLAKQHGVVVGAHPGYADREHFGRVEQDIRPGLFGLMVTSQVGELVRVAAERGLTVRYLKLHGAMYNQACRERRWAIAAVMAAEKFALPLVGLPGSQLEVVAKSRDCGFVPEGFADRRYNTDGSLVPRTDPNAFVHDPAEAVSQVEWLIREKGVRTICVHGDNPEAVAFTRAVRDALLSRGFTLKAFA